MQCHPAQQNAAACGARLQEAPQQKPRLLLPATLLPRGATGASTHFNKASNHFDRACIVRRFRRLARRPATPPPRRSGARSGTRPPGRAPRGPPRAARPRPPRRRAAPRTAPAAGSARRLTAALADCGCCRGRRTRHGAPCLQLCMRRLRHVDAAAVACERVLAGRTTSVQHPTD